MDQRSILAAYFNNSSNAAQAVEDLHRAGFSADQIGCSMDDADTIGMSGSRTGDTHLESGEHRSFWQKVEGFFSGEPSYEDRDTAIEGSTTGSAADRTLSIPHRYHERLSSGGCLVTVHNAGRFSEAEQILRRNGGEIDRDFYSRDTEMAGTSRTGADLNEQRRIRLFSERLRVNKERVQKGEVRLRKEVRTEKQTVEVPVTHEELVIERRPAEGTSTTGAQIGKSDAIRVPLSEERVRVDKTPVAREDVTVGKRAVQETETVADNVRHEELKVEGEGDVKRTGRDEGIDPKKRKIA